MDNNPDQNQTPTPTPESTESTPTPVTPETQPVTPDPVAPAEAPVEPVATPAPAPTTPSATDATAVTPGAKSHLVALLLSIFVGTLGIDRFYLGHIGLGIAKLLLSWATFGIWWIIDIILIATKKVKNVTWEQ